MIHLDTSFLVRATHAGTPESEIVREWIRAGEVFCMSTVAWTEYLCGESLTDEELLLATRIVSRRIDFTEEMAALSAKLFDDSGRRRRMVADCMIAATAITERAPIATSDLKDFRKFERFGLTLAPTNFH